MLEQEVKLAFDSLEAARRAVNAAGGPLVQSRRLQRDRFLDTPTSQLGNAKLALRLRREPNEAFLTYKGVPQGGPVKSREEIETRVDDADAIELILGRLGLVERWQFEKHREDYVIGDAKVFIDETAAGVFVEIEGHPDLIRQTAALLGRSPTDYILSSYRSLASD